MATLNSFIRSVNAATRQAERARQKRIRESARNFKQQRVMQEISSATSAVRAYEDYIDILKSVHKDVSETVDWSALFHEASPVAPAISNECEIEAKNRLLAFKPSFLDKVFGSSRKKVEKLSRQVELAKEADLHKYNKQLIEHTKLIEEQENLRKIAKGVLEKDINAYKDAVEYFQPFSEISELGSKMDLQVNPGNATVNLYLNNTSIIPDYALSITSTGRLSKKNLSATKFNEYYQDYVCSCILRVAREIFALLPLHLVVINAMGDMYNSATGLTREEVIVSVAITSDSLNNLNFELVDPSDAMKNFVHKMKFGKTAGFSPVEKMDANTLMNVN